MSSMKGKIMLKNKYLTVREFGRLTHTNIDTLKHYDRIGILKPAFVGENNYRYYLPEQAFLLTRILFGVKAKVQLSDIKETIVEDDPQKAYEHYLQINDNLQQMMEELQAIQNTIANLKYYYDLTIKHPVGEIFSNYFPEWFIICSPKLSLDTQAGSAESNIADNLFIRGFYNGMWPHYQLGCMYTQGDIEQNNFDSPIYCLKVDHPEEFNPAEITFVPAGDYYCLLLKVRGHGLRSAVRTFLQQLQEEHKSVQGNIFVLDVINNFITTSSENYCTMIYAHAVREDVAG